MAGQTLHGGLELTLEQSHDDGLVQQLVFAPGQVGCCLIIHMVVILLFVPLPVVRLTPETENMLIHKSNSSSRCKQAVFTTQEKLHKVNSSPNPFQFICMHFSQVIMIGRKI